MFEYERSYEEKGLSHKQIRNSPLKDQKPIIEGMLVWVKKVNLGSNSRLKKAITYILNRENVLMNYLENVCCSLSNNLSKNNIRPVILARKNWFFSDTQDGAHANKVYLSISVMGKAYDLNIYEYLKCLLEHRPNTEMSDKELDQSLPRNKYPQKFYKIILRKIAPPKPNSSCFGILLGYTPQDQALTLEDYHD